MLGVSVNLTLTRFDFEQFIESPELFPGRLQRLAEQGLEDV